MGIIYCCRNKINGKLYIGKTSKTLEKRMLYHVYDSKRPRTLFHKAIAKYGIDAFHISVLDSSDDEKELSMLEQIYIDMFSSSIRDIGYNLTYGGDGGTLNAESIAKMSASKKGQTPWMKGRKHTPETIEKIKASIRVSEARKYHHMLGKHHTKESIEKISRSKKMHPRHDVVCAECGAMFSAINKTAIYCSHKCALRAFRKRSKGEKTNEYQS